MLSCIGASYVFTNQSSPAAIKIADTRVRKARNGVSIVDSSGFIRRCRSVTGIVGYRDTNHGNRRSFNRIAWFSGRNQHHNEG